MSFTRFINDCKCNNTYFPVGFFRLGTPPLVSSHEPSPFFNFSNTDHCFFLTKRVPSEDASLSDARCLRGRWTTKTSCSTQSTSLRRSSSTRFSSTFAVFFVILPPSAETRSNAFSPCAYRRKSCPVRVKEILRGKLEAQSPDGR